MISIEMSQCQFNKVAEVIKNDHPEATLVFSESEASESKGHIHTSQIDADFEYRPRDNNEGTLVFENEQKHGMYKMVSDDTIGAHLNKLLGGIVCDEPVQETATEEINRGGDGFAEGNTPSGVPIPTSTNSFVKPTIQTGASS